jgi:hypothetical protein
MKTIRFALLGLMLSAGLVSGAHAHGPHVGLSVNLGYPVYAAPPVYYAPPPPIYYAPPPRIYYAPPPPLVYAPPYGYAGYSYRYDNGSHRGWHRHRNHRH